jgi:mannosyl-3-phosphoglycerate phosphatase
MKELLVVTDLDGTLLDEHTYDPAAAAGALCALEAARVPLVLASSKTRAEMEALVAALPGAPPLALIVENGGAVLRLDGRGGPALTVLGAPHEELVRALDAISREAGVRLARCSSMALEELVRLTGLGEADARRAQQREYDEPFLMDEAGDVARVAAAASRRGLRLSRGGRFLHLTGATDKGRAFHVLRGLLAAEGRTYHAVGLGDAPNDLPLLEAVDEPILVPRPDGRVDERLRQAFPGAARAEAPGPAGWNGAVLRLLERRLGGEAAARAR